MSRPTPIRRAGSPSWVVPARRSSTTSPSSTSSTATRGHRGRCRARSSFEALQQSAGRRAVLRDRDAFPLFVDAVESVAPLVERTIERVRSEIDAEAADRLADTLRRVFGRVLKELADLENPMRTLLGDEPGEGASRRVPDGAGPHGREVHRMRTDAADARRAGAERTAGRRRCAGRRRGADAESPAAPAVDRARSRAGTRPHRFDAEAGTVLYNDRHADFLLLKDNEAGAARLPRDARGQGVRRLQQPQS